MILIAIFFPSLSFLLRGKIFSAIIAFVLHIIAFFTMLLFGVGFMVWLGISIWAVISYSQARADKRNREMIEAMRDGRRY